jgi:hypothetical protein
MPSPKRSPGGPIPFAIDPGQIPDDGSSVTFEQTFAKKLGPATGTQNMLSDEDYEIFDWQLEYQHPNGKWAFLRKTKGRPYPHNMGEADAGNYRAMPIDRSGKLVDSQTKHFTIGAPSQAQGLHVVPPQMAEPSRVEEPVNAMPPWMQVLFQREAEERAEQRRRAEEDARRREAWERDQALKEEARREREERLAEIRAEREAQARKEAADRTNALIMAGMQLAQQVMQKPAAPEPRRDDRMQELLLSHVLSERSRPSNQAQGSIKESLELVVALDQLAQSRADRLPPPQAEEKEEEDVGTSMIKMLPMLLGGAAARGAGPSAAAPAAPAFNVDAVIGKALEDPAVVARIAAQNPEAIARTFSKVVKADKRIEEAVIRVLSEDDEEGA